MIVSRLRGLLIIGTLFMFVDDFFLRKGTELTDFLHRYDEHWLKLTLFSFVPSPSRTLYLSILLIIFACCFAIWIKRIHRTAALLLSLCIGYLGISNMIYTNNFHFFAAFSMLAMALLTTQDLQRFTRFHLILIYICCAIYRLSPIYFSGESVRLEILPQINLVFLKDWAMAQPVSQPFAILAFLTEIAILTGLLTRHFYLGFVLPLVFHIFLGLTTLATVANTFMIAAILGTSPEQWIYKSAATFKTNIKIRTILFILAFLTLMALAIFKVKLLTFIFVTLLFAWWTLKHRENKAVSSRFSKICFWPLAFTLTFYASVPLWDSNMTRQWYSYAMYSGRFYSGTRELYGLGKGLHYKTPGYDGVFSALGPQEFEGRRILRIAKLHWLPEYMRYICTPYHDNPREFESLDLYSGPALPDFAAAKPIISLSLPCLKSKDEWKKIAEQIRTQEDHSHAE